MKAIENVFVFSGQKGVGLYMYLVHPDKKEQLFLFFSQKQVFDYLHSNRQEINKEDREGVLAVSEKFLPEEVENAIVEFSEAQAKSMLELLVEHSLMQQELKKKPQIKKATAEDLFPEMFQLP